MGTSISIPLWCVLLTCGLQKRNSRLCATWGISPTTPSTIGPSTGCTSSTSSWTVWSKTKKRWCWQPSVGWQTVQLVCWDHHHTKTKRASTDTVAPPLGHKCTHPPATQPQLPPLSCIHVMSSSRHTSFGHWPDVYSVWSVLCPHVACASDRVVQQQIEEADGVDEIIACFLHEGRGPAALTSAMMCLMDLLAHPTLGIKSWVMFGQCRNSFACRIFSLSLSLSVCMYLCMYEGIHMCVFVPMSPSLSLFRTTSHTVVHVCYCCGLMCGHNHLAQSLGILPSRSVFGDSLATKLGTREEKKKKWNQNGK